MDIHKDIHASTGSSSRISMVSRTMRHGYPEVSAGTCDGTDDSTRISMVTQISLRISVRTKHGPFDPGIWYTGLVSFEPIVKKKLVGSPNRIGRSLMHS